MEILAFDVETHLIQPGLLAPPLVVGSFADASGAYLLTRKESRGVFRDMVRGSDLLSGANIPYDFGVMLADAERRGEGVDELLADVVRFMESDKCFDILINQELHDIARGCRGVAPDGQKFDRYSLDLVTRLTLGRDDAKDRDFWRKRYAWLEHLPHDLWPEDAREYPKDDARNTRGCMLGQLGMNERGETVGAPHRNIHYAAETCRVKLALHLGAIWGLRTNGARVDLLERVAAEKHREFVSHFQSLGLWGDTDDEGNAKADGKAIKTAVAVAYGADPASKCERCGGTGKRPSPKTKKPVICGPRTFGRTDPGCDGTGLVIDGLIFLPRTPGGGICADRDAKLESGDDDLVALGDNAHEKCLTTHVPFLREGVTRPMNLRPNVLVTSLRCSYDGIIQQMPRGGDARECVEARPGYVLCSTDYSGIELCTLAQSSIWLVGWSRMAEIINASGDPGALHGAFGAKMAGMTVDDFMAALAKKDRQAKDFRQAAKAANFGFPGGMGAVKVCIAKRKPNEGVTVAPDGKVYPGIRFCILLGGADRCGKIKITSWGPKGQERDCPPVCKACVEQAALLRSEWLKMFPEVPKYFKEVKAIVEHSAEIVIRGVNVTRGGVAFTDGANGYFQGLAAVGAKRALWKIAREIMCGRTPEGEPSPLLGSHMPFFVHDEPVSELWEPSAHEAAHRICDLMIAGMGELVPDVKVKVEPALMRRWLKAAEPEYRDGRLVPWEPPCAPAKAA